MSSSADATVINDRYEIHKRVGRGGMADVFLARDLLLDRQVAIKVLFPEFAIDPNFVERFRREAQAAANLSHPNIVNVFDWGKYEGTYFIAMEYVQGRTLADILRSNSRLTPKQSAEIASEVAAGLGFAHDNGLVHRDIKPANILIGSNGQVKVADFGIARAMNSAAETHLTQAGSVMGTASYFSPEQAQGAQPDPRSDLYSLGIVMYEMVSGKPPFSGENAVAIAYKQVHDQPTPLNQLVDGVPRAYEAIVAKLLAKNPQMRYQTAGELRDDLRRFRSGEPVHALAAAAGRPSSPDATTVMSPEQDTRVISTAENAGPTVVMRNQPTIAGAPSAPATEVAYADVTQYPPGASPEARYYQDSNSRTGWYALIAFLALLALVAGGVLLYQNLTKEAVDTTAFPLANYVGQPIDVVTAELQELKLGVSAVPQEDPSVPENVVFRTDPDEGTLVTEGQVIYVYYNPTKNLVPVTTVTGLTLAEATAKLSADGFQLGTTTTETNDSVPEGHVIRTDPPAGEMVPQDTPINIVVSGGPNLVTIPSDIINSSQDAATNKLQNELGLVVNVQLQASSTVPAGTVINIDPGPNTLVPTGSTVTLVVSSGPAQVVVPALVGNSEATARQVVGDLGLQIDVTYQELPAGDSRNGTVIEQSLAVGANVDVGSTVRVVVGTAAAATTTAAPQVTTTTAAPQITTTTTAPPQITTTTSTTSPATTTTLAPG